MLDKKFIASRRASSQMLSPAARPTRADMLAYAAAGAMTPHSCAEDAASCGLPDHPAQCIQPTDLRI